MNHDRESPRDRKWLRMAAVLLRDGGCPHSPVCPEIGVTITIDKPIGYEPYCVRHDGQQYPYQHANPYRNVKI